MGSVRSGHHLPYVRKPCSNCPMRKTAMRGWLGGDRMREILESDSFVCHKTVNDRVESRRQCAGHMLLAPINRFVSLAQAMGFELSLTGRELLFDDVEQCIEHHKS